MMTDQLSSTQYRYMVSACNVMLKKHLSARHLKLLLLLHRYEGYDREHLFDCSEEGCYKNFNDLINQLNGNSRYVTKKKYIKFGRRITSIDPSKTGIAGKGLYLTYHGKKIIDVCRNH